MKLNRSDGKLEDLDSGLKESLLSNYIKKKQKRSLKESN